MTKTLARNVWIFFLAVMFVLAGGCGRQETPAGAVAVRVLTMQQAGPTPDEMNAIAAEFGKTAGGAKVEIEYVAYDALHDKIVTALAAKPPAYDVILVDDIWYAEFAKAGYLVDVTDRISPEMRKNIFPSGWDVTTVNGRTYGMPWMLDAKYFFYNEKLLAAAGFKTPPRTLEELVTQARALKAKKIVEYPLVWSWNQAETVVCDFVALVYGNGGRLLDEAGKPAFNEPAAVEALAWMRKTIEDGLTNPSSVTYVEEDVRNVFCQGHAAFALNWLYMYEPANLNTKESRVAGQVGMALIPVSEKAMKAGIKSATINGSMGFSVVAGSPRKDAAWGFVKFLCSEEIQTRYSAHLLPVWESCYTGPAREKLLKTNAATPVTVPMFGRQFPFAKVRPRVPYYMEGSKNLQFAIQSALTGKKSAKEALDEAAAKWRKLGADR